MNTNPISPCLRQGYSQRRFRSTVVALIALVGISSGHANLIMTIWSPSDSQVVNWHAKGSLTDAALSNFSTPILGGVNTTSQKFPNDSDFEWTDIWNLGDVNDTNIIDVTLENRVFTGTLTETFRVHGLGDRVRTVSSANGNIDIQNSGDDDYIDFDLVTGIFTFPNIGTGDLNSVSWDGSGTVDLGSGNTFNSVFNLGTKTFQAGGVGGNGSLIQFTVSTTNPVPEPSGALLSALLVMGALLRRSR